MIRVFGKNALVGLLGGVELLLLLVNVTNLEPDVDLGEWAWRVVEDVSEAFETGGELVLLLVYDAETEVDLVGLFVVGSMRTTLAKASSACSRLP